MTKREELIALILEGDLPGAQACLAEIEGVQHEGTKEDETT